MYLLCHYINMKNLKHTMGWLCKAFTHIDTNGESERGINKNLDLSVRGRLQANLLYVLGTN